MIVLNYGHLNSQLPGALDHIASMPLEPKVAWQVMKINRKVNSELKLARELFQKSISKHALLDEQGNWVPKKTEKGQVIAPYQPAPGKEEEMKKELDEVQTISFEVKANRLNISQFAQPGIKLSADDLTILEPVFEDLEDKPSLAAVPTPPPAVEVPSVPPTGVVQA